MGPDEIIALLNEYEHDGEVDWSFHELHRVYFSRLQAGREGALPKPLSEASGEIIARHYHMMKVLEIEKKFGVPSSPRRPEPITRLGDGLRIEFAEPQPAQDIVPGLEASMRRIRKEAEEADKKSGYVDPTFNEFTSMRLQRIEDDEERHKTSKVACIEVTRPETHGEKLKCVYRLAGFLAADEFEGALEGEQICLTLRMLTEEEIAALPEFRGW